MSRLERLTADTWEAFLCSRVSVLVLARTDCLVSDAWAQSLEAFLADDDQWRHVRFGLIHLDRPGLLSFKKANSWIEDLRGLPYTLISVDGEPRRDFVGGDLARLTEILGRET